MTSMHRSLARLPLDIFENLQYQEELAEAATSMVLRRSICAKLRQPPRNLRDVKEPITTVGLFLKPSLITILQLLDPLLTHEECMTLRTRICQHCAPRAVSALTVLRARQAILSTGMPHLDELLKGGFRVGTISELVGAAGAGKTQLAMQLCVIAAKCGYGTTYIDTEKKLRLERLQEIAHIRAFGEEQQQQQQDENGFGYCSRSLQAQQELLNGYKNPNEVLQNITIHSPSSTNELLAVIQSLEEEILLRNEEALESSSTAKFPVRLLIVDSIAAPTRRDFGADSAIQRVGLLMEVASLLKRLADQLQLAVVVINQVGSSKKSAGSDIYQEVQAALGNSWAHCLSTRVAMEQEASAVVGMGGGCWRRATIVKSNVAANKSMYYTVANQGLLESASIKEEQVVPMQ